MLDFIIPHLADKCSIDGLFVEPFVGSGAIFFALNPKKAILADINPMLIDLYLGLKNYPMEVWEIFNSFPSTKKAYYQIRNSHNNKNLTYKAAKMLYLNRTCFKGMWRENADGQFNVGYGGQDRRWVVNKEIILKVSKRLKRAILKSCDFEEVINNCCEGDFIFADPPYKPGEKELKHSHYVCSKFSYDDHKRLANAMKKATKRKVKWAITTSSHPDIKSLFRGNHVICFNRGTGKSPGIMSNNSGEVLICNYQEG